MNDNDTSRLSRLTAILILLQTKRITTASSLATKFDVSIRTIYRDIRALEEAGVPILTEEGKGYYLMDGYRIPPVSFTESEANALITAQKIISNNSDQSFVQEYDKSIEKIKAVLRYSAKESTELLAERMVVARNNETINNASSFVTSLQLALTNFSVTEIEYQKSPEDPATLRMVEPFALLSTQGNWLLVAMCRLRNEFRLFRLDRMKRIRVLDEKFEPHKMTLQEYFEKSWT